MQAMRDVIRNSLARSLHRLGHEERLAAALPVVCGSALGSHCEVLGLDSEGGLHIRVDAPEWLASLRGMQERLQHDLGRVAGVSLTGLHFALAASGPGRAPLPREK